MAYVCQWKDTYEKEKKEGEIRGGRENRGREQGIWRNGSVENEE